MDLLVKNHIACISGGSRGIGKTIALTLAKEGVHIILLGRNEKTLEDTKNIILAEGVKVWTLSLDLKDDQETAKKLPELLSEIGGLDILVNNVGGVETFGGFFDLTLQDWKESFDLNFFSAVSATAAVLPYLKKSQCGRIINISTVPAKQPGWFNPHYSAAKAALINLTKHLANTLAKDRILVNAICPGTLGGEAWERNILDKAQRLNISPEEARSAMEKEEQAKVPLGTIGDPEDIANLVAFLASPRAKFITGTCIQVDGGVVRSIF